MSFFRRILDRFTSTEPAASSDGHSEVPRQPASAQQPSGLPATVDSEPLAKLARVGEPEGPSDQDAMALLRAARGTQQEAAALDYILAAPAAGEQLRIAAAEILASRGQPHDALALLSKVTATAGLILQADLQAASGDLSRALAAIERVLARDIASPGAKERRARFARALGIGATQQRTDEATVLTGRGTSAPYRILREVARGGAGTVYEAEDEVLVRRIAFKVFHQGEADRTLVEREIRLSSTLSGCGVVRFLDASPEQAWVAMEWMQLGSLRDVLAQGRSAILAPATDWALPLAEALASFHGKGWCHLDVKPANVLLRSRSEPLLTDFGLVRKVGEVVRGGSPGYVAPERLAGQNAAFSDDVYGFGRILEDVLMATGEHQPELQALTQACLSPRGQRPQDGFALVRQLRQSR